MPTPEQIYRVAVAAHECGHCVCALAIGARGVFIEMDPADATHAAGVTYFIQSSLGPNGSAEAIVRELVIDAAGRVAERMAVPKWAGMIHSMRCKEQGPRGEPGSDERSTDRASNLLDALGYDGRLAAFRAPDVARSIITANWDVFREMTSHVLSLGNVYADDPLLARVRRFEFDPMRLLDTSVDLTGT